MGLDLGLDLVPGLIEGGPTNTVAPAIEAVAVIGTEITGDDGTWVNAVSFTYQWQRNAGSWTNIAGATSKDYTPVDADFGYQLRLVVTANGAVAADSNATNLTQEAPAQALGAEMLTDGDMEDADTSAYVAGNGAVLSKQADPYEGLLCLRVARDATNNPFARASSALVAGSYYETLGAARSDGNAVPKCFFGSTTTIIQLSATASWMPFIANTRADNVLLLFQAITSTGNQYAEFDAMSLKLKTINAQLTAPSANMRLDGFYTLPVSPVTGTEVWILPRISDFAAGNYWNAILTYTGAQWNINLYSVASSTRTSRIAATNIGATNGIRVNLNADSISLYTTANGGTDWTQRGTTISNALYQTSTGVNMMWTSDVTPGNLVYAPAD